MRAPQGLGLYQEDMLPQEEGLPSASRAVEEVHASARAPWVSIIQDSYYTRNAQIKNCCLTLLLNMYAAWGKPCGRRTIRLKARLIPSWRRIGVGQPYGTERGRQGTRSLSWG